MSTKESLTEEEDATEVEFTTITLTDVTKEIGLTEDTTAMESSLGLKEVSSKDSTSKDLDMVTVFTGFTPEILTPANGSMVKAMASVFRHVLMEALMSESLSSVSNMDLDLTSSGNKKKKDFFVCIYIYLVKCIFCIFFFCGKMYFYYIKRSLCFVSEL